MTSPIAFGAKIGVDALTGLFKGQAERAAEERKRAEQKRQQAFGAQQQALTNLSTGQQRAFQGLIGTFGKALGV